MFFSPGSENEFHALVFVSAPPYGRDCRCRLHYGSDHHSYRACERFKSGADYAADPAGMQMEPPLTCKARFDAYQALNKIYGTYFSPSKAPSRSCMALEWIPSDSLIEVAGSAMVGQSTRPFVELVIIG
jgi:hypothetical protein